MCYGRLLGPGSSVLSLRLCELTKNAELLAGTFKVSFFQHIMENKCSSLFHMDFMVLKGKKKNGFLCYQTNTTLQGHFE